MKSTLLVVLYAAIAFAGFGPNVRIDHENNPDRGCGYPAITLGPGKGSNQTLYVVFTDDSLHMRCGLWFQKSTDAGKTWLSADVIIRRDTGFSPDITTDPDGNIYVVAEDGGRQIYSMRSTDGGSTWSEPVRVNDTLADHGWARIAADSAGNLFCAWGDCRTGWERIWSSVSTDRGTTWSQNVRVDDDTLWDDCCQADVFVQPGSNHYLVVAAAPYDNGSHVVYGSYLYRSTDMGRTFQPGVRLDTNKGLDATGEPHVVADAQHIICDYCAITTEARTLYTQPDTWGAPHFIGNAYYNGNRLAISADGRVHTALMAGDTDRVFYTFSSDYGASWSDPELVSEDTVTLDIDAPDIGADSAGHAYIVWMTTQTQNSEVWFATNNPAAIAEQPSQRQPHGTQLFATMVHNVLFLQEATSPKLQASSLLDIGGRKIMDLRTGANDVRALAPGVYFVREAQAQAQAQAVRKIVVTR